MKLDESRRPQKKTSVPSSKFLPLLSSFPSFPLPALAKVILTFGVDSERVTPRIQGSIAVSESQLEGGQRKPCPEEQRRRGGGRERERTGSRCLC